METDTIMCNQKLNTLTTINIISVRRKNSDLFRKESDKLYAFFIFSPQRIKYCTSNLTQVTV
jgi:hypothetical protein